MLLLWTNVSATSQETKFRRGMGGPSRFDFFLSRRGSVATIAREVTDVLTEKGYKVLVQDYDIPLGASFVEAMHEAIINSRDLIILFTEDYLQSPYTRKEFTSFEAERVKTGEERQIIVLRCDDVPLRGLLADNVYQTLVGIEDPEERKGRIVAAAERQSQAAPPPPRPFIGVPPRIASFRGRADELDKLDDILMHDKPAAVTQASVGRAAVRGMGGIGKTSLAIEYAHRFRGLYAGVCWCPAETHTGLLSALASLAVTFGAATTEEADVDKAAKSALRRLAEQRATWLLVYDNVPAPDAVADLLPSAGARVLITSRFSDWSELADEVALGVLPPEEAIALLEGRAGRSDTAGAKALAEALDRLPLALDHAAAYCKRTQMPFADYTKKASSLIDIAPRGVGYPRSVAATFDLAIIEAVAQCRAAEALMAYLAQCAPERIPMTLVEGTIDEEAERMKALAALAEVSLVRHDPFEDGTPAVTVHRLVQAVARARSEANGSAKDAVGRLIARLVAIYPKQSRDWQSWPLCAHFTPHLLARRDACPDEASVFEGWPKLLNRTGNYFLGRAAYPQALPLLRDALAIHEKAFGPEHPDTAESLNNLATLLLDQGDFAGAQPLFERALAIREKALGPEHPDTAQTLSNLGALLQAKATLRGPGRSWSARWHYVKRRSASSIPIRRKPSTTSAPCFDTRATLMERVRFWSARWRAYKRRLAQNIQTPISRAPIYLTYYFSPAVQTKRSRSSKRPSPHTTRFLDQCMPGLSVVLRSTPMRSTRLAAPRRRRRCGSGMGSRVLTKLSRREPHPLAAHSARKSQTTTAGFTGFF
jgi:tetratricopeptide (TPR) repeat protein